jgi:hypothetical protein
MGVDDREEQSPLYPAAAIMFDVGVIVGAHKTAAIANAIQEKLSKLLESAMAEHEFDMKDWGVFCHSRANRIDHVWYIECSSAGVQEVVATELKDYTFMLLPDDLTGPADKLKRLQKTVMRFVKEAEEQLEVKEWAPGELAQMARKAYKTAQPAINAAIDVRLLASFEIMDVWEMATPEQAQERKHEWNGAKKAFVKNFTHGRKCRQTLARAIMLNPDEAGAWSDELKKEANTQAIELRRALHRLLGEVVVVQHLGQAQAIPEEGARRRRSVEMSWRVETCAWLSPPPTLKIYRKTWQG